MTDILPLPTVMVEHPFTTNTIRVFHDTAGQQWFLAIDILRAIGYGVDPATGKVKQGSAITNMSDEHTRLISVPCDRGKRCARQSQMTTVLSPDGLTHLLTRSLKPGAKPLLRFAEGAGWIEVSRRRPQKGRMALQTRGKAIDRQVP